MFLNLVCSSNDTFSDFLKRLLGNAERPSVSELELLDRAELPEPSLKRSSKSTKSMMECSLSSSSSLNIVPRT